jgi:hypothetical protein
MDAASVFEHQEDITLKLHGKLGEPREAEAHGGWDVSDPLVLAFN